MTKFSCGRRPPRFRTCRRKCESQSCGVSSARIERDFDRPHDRIAIRPCRPASRGGPIGVIARGRTMAENCSADGSAGSERFPSRNGTGESIRTGRAMLRRLSKLEGAAGRSPDPTGSATPDRRRPPAIAATSTAATRVPPPASHRLPAFCQEPFRNHPPDEACCKARVCDAGAKAGGADRRYPATGGV